jgi:hypothetical protein
MKLPLTSSDNNAQLASLQRPYSAVQGNAVSTGSTVIATGGNIRSGQAAYDSGTGFWLGNDAGVPKFSIGDSSGDKMTWDGSALSVTGNLTATTGTIGGWTIGATTITGGNVTLDSAGNIRAGQTAYDTGAGFWLGVDSGTPKFSIGNNSTSSLTWDGTSLSIQGDIIYNVDTSTHARFLSNTSDGSDIGSILFSGGGEPNGNRGATLTLRGNESGASDPGSATLAAGLVVGAQVSLSSGATSLLITSSEIQIACDGGSFRPSTNDGEALGTSSAGWSDLFLAEGGVINWDNGDATLTQAGNVVTLAGATLTADVNGTIGATTPAAGSFTTATASGLVDISGASAGQIKFPAAQNSSSDANTLDDYEEGTYTPAPEGTGTAGTPTGTFAGHYIKIGSQVWVTVQLVFTALTGMVGNLIVRNLPFTAISGSASRAALAVAFRGNFTNDFPIVVRVAENTTDAVPTKADLDNTAVAIADMSATTNLYFSGCYRAAA